MKQINKTANFWIRILVRFIDFLIIFTLSSSFLPIIFTQRNGEWTFVSPFLFYFWILYTIGLFFFFLILLPFLWKGKTLGSYVFRTKIVSSNSNSLFFKNVSKREIVGAWGFIFIILSFGLILNHTMILKVININDLENLGTFENFRLSLVSTLSGFVILCQMIVAISTLVRKDKKALNDVYAKTTFVYINKFIRTKKSKKDIKIIPKFVKDEPIEWIK